MKINSDTIYSTKKQNEMLIKLYYSLCQKIEDEKEHEKN